VCSTYHNPRCYLVGLCEAILASYSPFGGTVYHPSLSAELHKDRNSGLCTGIVAIRSVQLFVGPMQPIDSSTLSSAIASASPSASADQSSTGAASKTITLDDEAILAGPQTYVVFYGLIYDIFINSQTEQQNPIASNAIDLSLGKTSSSEARFAIACILLHNISHLYVLVTKLAQDIPHRVV